MLITDGNIDLVKPLAFFSIKKIFVERITKIIKKEADYKLLVGKRLLFRPSKLASGASSRGRT